MTNQAHGSSLLQARGDHHNQLHDRQDQDQDQDQDQNHHNHNHQIHHNRLHARNQDTNQLLHNNKNKRQHHPNHIRSPDDPNKLNKLQGRQVVVVHQTVSIVHVINGAGSVVGIQTVLPQDINSVVTPLQPLKLTTGVTTVDSGNLGANATPSVLPTLALPTIGDGVAPSSSAPPSASTGVIPGSDAPSSLSLNSGSLSGSLTSAPSSSSTRFPTLSGSGGFFSANSTRGPSLFSNSTKKPPSFFVNSTRSANERESASHTKTSTKSRSSTTLWTSRTDVPIVTTAAGPIGNPGIGNVASPVPLPTTESSPEPKGLTPETQGIVAGGVVGGVAGIALLVLFAMFWLRWKKRNGGAIRLLGDGESTARGGIGGPASGPSGLGGDGGGPGGMMERRSIPFAIPASLASLTGPKGLMDGPAESGGPSRGEKGFYRVSGKKLISVLQSGGDGYSDPHDSMMSTASYYRDSMFPDSLPPQRLQLGSPMRPESGVPIMRSGPGRTPIQEQTGFLFDPHPSPPPSVTADPLGRSLISQDRSRGSGTGSGRTRFTEEL